MNRTTNLKQQDSKKQSHFLKKKVLKQIPQQHSKVLQHQPIITIPQNKNKTQFLSTTIQSTVKLSVVPKYSHMDYQILDK